MLARIYIYIYIHACTHMCIESEEITGEEIFFISLSFSCNVKAFPPSSRRLIFPHDARVSTLYPRSWNERDSV